MNDADKILQELRGLRTDVKSLQEGQKSLQDTVDRHGKTLSGLTGSVATILEEHAAQRTDIRALHTEVHASKEELREEILSSREEAKRDNMDLKATVIKQLKDHGKRIGTLEDAAGIPNPNKH